MEDCINQYVNKTIDQENKLKLAIHLKECPHCRQELALTIKLQEVLAREMLEVPQELLTKTFTQIEESQLARNNLGSKIKSTLEPLEIVVEILVTTKKSLNLALQFF